MRTAKQEQAREAIGARTADPPMRRADIYFRTLVFGVVAEHTRRKTEAEDLADGLPKRLTEGRLLEKTGLVEYRAKQGGRITAARLAKILDFCVAMGSLTGWEPDGEGFYRVRLPAPEPVEVVEQGEVFSQLEAGEG